MSCCHVSRPRISTPSSFGTRHRPRVAVQRTRRVVRASASPTDVFVVGLECLILDALPANVRSAGRAAASLFPDVVPRTVLNDAELLKNVTTVSKDHSLFPWQQLAMVKSAAEGYPITDVQHMKTTLASATQSAEAWTEAFLTEQKKWLAEDPEEWLKWIEVFPGMADALKDCPYPFYIITSLCPQGAEHIMKTVLDQGDIKADSPRLCFHQETDRIHAIRDISKRSLCQNARRLHYIDGSLAALEAVEAATDLKAWNLYCSNWCCPSSANISRAKQLGAQILSLSNFRELLKWGILMGVDDGCEPTAEEVKVGVQ